MAKKTRKAVLKKTAKKSVKKAAVKKTRKTSVKSKPRSPRKNKPASIGDRLSNAYQAVVDTVKGTGKLRDKMEKPGTSESE